jgi:hypothetical protein
MNIPQNIFSSNNKNITFHLTVLLNYSHRGSAGAFNAALWLIFALGKKKRGGMFRPVAIRQHINVMFLPLSPVGSFTTCFLPSTECGLLLI